MQIRGRFRGRNGNDFSISQLFLNSVAGLAYDYSDAANFLWRWNLLTWTEDFTNAAWIKGGTTITANVDVGPDGSMTADKIVEIAANSTHTVLQVVPGSVIGATESYVIEAKADGRSVFALQIGGSAYAYFDLASGTVPGTGGGGIGQITPLPNGWFRCKVTGVRTATQNVGLILATSFAVITYLGDGVSGIRVRAPQVISGSGDMPYQRITSPDVDAAFYLPKNPNYQDDLFTTALTTPDQTLGGSLDVSRGLTLGPELVTNGDNEVSVAVAPLDSLTNFVTKDRSADRSQSGLYSAKLTANAVSGSHYWRLINVASNETVEVAGWVYVPTGATAGQPIKLIDIFDGSFTASIAATFDNWIYFNVIRPAKGTAWTLALGQDIPADWAGGSIYVDNISIKKVNAIPLRQSNTAWRPKWGRAPKVKRNQLNETEFRNGLTDAPTRAGLITAVSGVNFSRFVTSGIAFGYDGVTDNYAYKTLNALAVDYTFSAFVLMDTDGAPNFGHVTPANVLNDFALVLASGAPSPTNYAVEPLGGRAYRVSVSGIGTVGVKSFGVVKYATNSNRTFTVTGYHAEFGLVKTPYQKVTTVFDMTEANMPSFGFIRPDLGDDVLNATIPVAQTGDVLVFGRNGSWIESNVTYGAGSTWAVGTKTITGLPQNLLSAIGDIVGIIAIGRTLTAIERTQALEYYKARGAAGWLVEGAEMLTNGQFTTDLTGWTNENISRGTSTWVAGQAFLENTGTGNTILWQSVPTIIGQAYSVKWDAVEANGVATARCFAGTNATNGANFSIISPTPPSTNKAVFIATAATTFISLVAFGATGSAKFDNVSLKPLTVQ